MTDKNNPASPCEFGNSSGKDVEVAGVTIPRKSTLSFGGLTAGEYAAIHLKVPDSGTPWLDEMIEKARRDELAARAMQSMADRVSQMTGTSAYYGENVSATDIFSKFTFKWADAMLAASKGEK